MSPSPVERAQTAIVEAACDGWAAVCVALEDDPDACLEALRLGLADWYSHDSEDLAEALHDFGDPIAPFALVLGEPRVQTMLDTLGVALDVRATLHRYDALYRAEAALALPEASAIAACEAALAELPLVDPAVAYAWERAATKLSASALLVRSELSERSRAHARRAIRKMTSAHALLKSLIGEGTDPRRAIEEVAQVWADAAPVEGAASDVVGLLSSILVHAARPVAEAFDLVPDLPLDADTLGRMRVHGLRASRAALVLLEREQLGGADLASRLLAAGYTDVEVFDAMRENGVASLATLVALRDVGFSVGRLSEVLVADGAFVVVARDRLLELGLSEHRVGELLAPHVDRETLRLLFPGREPRLG